MSLNSTLQDIERELLALKRQKMKSASVLAVEKKTVTLNFHCQWLDYDLGATQAAYITATASGNALASLTFDGAWDGRIYEARRISESAGRITWVVAPTVFKEEDYGSGTSASFDITIPVTISTTSSTAVTLNYGSNPYTRAY